VLPLCPGVGIGARGEQSLRHLDVVGAHREVQRRLALHARCAHIGPGDNQCRGGLATPQGRSQVQGRVAGHGIPQLHVGACRHKQLHHLRAVCGRGEVQGRLAQPTGGVHIRPVSQQLASKPGVALGHRLV